MMNAHYIEFFFDCSSPWTYLSFKAINQLANENNIDADIIVPVPDSGNAAALGFAQRLNKNYEHVLIRNHYV